MIIILGPKKSRTTFFFWVAEICVTVRRNQVRIAPVQYLSHGARRRGHVVERLRSSTCSPELIQDDVLNVLTTQTTAGDTEKCNMRTSKPHNTNKLAPNDLEEPTTCRYANGNPLILGRRRRQLTPLVTQKWLSTGGAQPDGVSETAPVMHSKLLAAALGLT